MKCPYCDGKGRIYLYDPCRGSWETCRVCKGTKVLKTRRLVRAKCPDCDGVGWLSTLGSMYQVGACEKCKRCYGAGKVLRYRKIKVKV